jgi:acyl carrier protein
MEELFMNVTTKMEEIFRKCLKLDASAAIPDNWEPGNPVEWDSIANMSLISSLEDEFNISIEFEDLLEITNWGQFKKYIGEKVK